MSRYELEIDGRVYEVDLSRLDDGEARVEVDGRPYTVQVRSEGRPDEAPSAGGGRAQRLQASSRPGPRKPAGGSGGASEVRAPMPGVIRDILVQPGETVQIRQTLLRMEAMKMENDIQSPRAGRVAEIHVERSEEVSNDQLLVTLEGEGADD